jgi:hypothetical protein
MGIQGVDYVVAARIDYKRGHLHLAQLGANQPGKLNYRGGGVQG